MATQVTTITESVYPSEPNIAQLKMMQSPIVMVYKITKGEKGKEQTQLIINGLTGVKTGDILQLQDTLPTGTVYKDSGPGIYRFSVTDAESDAKCIWQTRLGSASLMSEPTPAAPAPALPFAMGLGRPLFAPAPPISAAPPSSGVRSLGNGFAYDQELEILTLPDGSAHPWRKGMPLPSMAITPPAVSASTPVSQLGGPGVPFFGAPSPELEATKAALAETKQALAEMQRRQDQERREAAHQQDMDQLRMAITKLAEQLTAKPQENPEVAEIRRRLERQDELAAIRADSKAQLDAVLTLVREQSANRGVDPMVTFMTSMMKDGQIATAETLRMIRETAASERQTLMAMMDRQAAAAEKAAANNPLDKVSSIFDVLVDKFGRVMELERSFSGAGGGTDWMSVIKEVGSRAGSALQVYQQAKAQEARAAEVKAHAQIATARAHEARSRAVAGQKPPAAAPAGKQPAAVAPVPSPTRVKIELPDLEKATIKDLREVFNPERDEVFFGDFFEHVGQLRTAIAASPSDFSAQRIAELLMQAREFIAQEAEEGRVPHAAEIWAHGQVAYLLERLLPEASEGLRSEIAKVLVQLQSEEDNRQRVAANERDTAEEDG